MLLHAAGHISAPSACETYGWEVSPRHAHPHFGNFPMPKGGPEPTAPKGTSFCISQRFSHYLLPASSLFHRCCRSTIPSPHPPPQSLHFHALITYPPCTSKDVSLLWTTLFPQPQPGPNPMRLHEWVVLVHT
eukprot:GGOE01010345.1.p1 GENE.GGOE01010345.1~~GGOE01010345.1.p1  ORF type:complete len:132 (-),score=3.90 GGOE01010345.1:434-829(-)